MTSKFIHVAASAWLSSGPWRWGAQSREGARIQPQGRGEAGPAGVLGNEDRETGQYLSGGTTTLGGLYRYCLRPREGLYVWWGEW